MKWGALRFLRNDYHERDADCKFWSCHDCKHAESIQAGDPDNHRAFKTCPECGGKMSKEY